MANVEERPPSLGWLLIGTLAVIAAVFILVSAVVGMIMGFVKLVILAIAGVAIVSWAIGRKIER